MFLSDAAPITDGLLWWRGGIALKVCVRQAAPASMAAIYAYFYMRDIEVGNITTIIEGIRYNFDSDAIGKLLVR